MTGHDCTVIDIFLDQFAQYTITITINFFIFLWMAELMRNDNRPVMIIVTLR